MLKKLMALGCIAAVLGCESQTEKGPENLILGPYKFVIPKYNIEPSYWSGYPYFPEEKKTKDPIESRTCVLQWSTEDLASRVKGFVRPRNVNGEFINSIRVIFYFPDDEGRRQYALNVRDAEAELAAKLLGGGDEPDPIIEAIPGTTWFRMKHIDHPNSSWTIVRDLPEPGNEQALVSQERSIATCSPNEIGGSSCAISFQLHSLGLHLETHLSEQNVLLYEKIADAILKDLGSWIIDNRYSTSDLGT